MQMIKFDSDNHFNTFMTKPTKRLIFLKSMAIKKNKQLFTDKENKTSEKDFGH